MRKIIIATGIVALAGVPVLATATVTPASMNIMLLQDTSSEAPPAPMHVKKHAQFLPLGLAALALAGGGIAAVASGSGNSPS
jgi:hypothetical protein